MEQQGLPNEGREEAAPGAASQAFVRIERRLGAPRLFATAYSTVGSSIYFALGVVAAYALGLTPLVFLIAGLLFILTTLTYFEGMTVHPERGGSAVMARHAFNELWSFVAGWAILLDYLILIAITSLSVGHYLSAFWDHFGDDQIDLAIALAVVAGVAYYNFRGLAPRGRRSTVLAIVDLSLVIVIVVLGLALVYDPGAITDTVQLGSVPSWSDLIFGMTIAVIAFTGIEAASNLAPEVRVSRGALKRTVAAGAIVVLFVFVGMSTVALMALPVAENVPVVGDQNAAFGTRLGGEFVEAPVLGVVESLTSSWVSEALSYAVAAVATAVLVTAANAGMVGIARTSYTLATHRQIPRAMARLHPHYMTPWIVIVAAGLLASLLLIPVDIELLAGMFAYGALIAFALAHLSVCALRWRDPERRRAFKVPLNVRIQGREVPLPAALGALLSIAAWIGVFFYHDDARLLGTGWMIAGLGLYVTYRRRQGLPLTRLVEVSPTTLSAPEPEIEFGTILVPIFGDPLDDDIMSTAGQLASEGRPKEGEGGGVIQALYVTTIPMSLPLDVRLPREKVEAALRALERAKQIGEEYAGVEVGTSIVPGRRVGPAIVGAARKFAVEAIVIGAEPPSRIKGGGVLGGVSGSRPRELGEVTAYVLEKSPCRVIVTAPPERGGGGDGEVPSSGARRSEPGADRNEVAPAAGARGRRDGGEQYKDAS